MTEKRNPDLIEVLDAVIDRHICEMHTSMPCEVVKYDYSKNMVEVQPSLKVKFKTKEESEKLPIITNVPVAFQRMGNGHLRLPVNKGDTGHLIFNERSIDGWLASGGIIDPLDPRKHALSDAVFYPGLSPRSNPIESSAAEDSLELKLGSSFLEILANGKFKITNGSEDLIDLIDQILDEIINTENSLVNAKTNTMFGPMPLLNAADFAGYKSSLESIKSLLGNLKGA